MEMKQEFKIKDMRWNYVCMRRFMNDFYQAWTFGCQLPVGEGIRVDNGFEQGWIYYIVCDKLITLMEKHEKRLSNYDKSN
jgi:hypothetical protein